jgi:hypothetical protein
MMKSLVERRYTQQHRQTDRQTDKHTVPTSGFRFMYLLVETVDVTLLVIKLI